MKIFLLFIFLSTTQSKEDINGLKIYIFEVGQANSQLIVFPSGYSILIDLGEDDVQGKGNAEYVSGRIEEILGRKEVDVLVLTHYHADHHGRIKKGGLWYLIEELDFKFNKFIDRDIGTYDSDILDDCNQDTMTWKNAGEMGVLTEEWACYATPTKNKTKLSKIREVAKICTSHQIEPPDEGAKVEVIFRDAIGVKDSNGNRIDGNHVGKSWPPGENDYSLSLKITYGDFVYSVCGDLSGYEMEDHTEFYFHDVESTVAPMMGEVDVYHVNHHGLETSTNELWTKTLKPTVSIVSCLVGAPVNDVLKRLVNVGGIIYTTNDCWARWDLTNDYPDDTIIFKADVILTVPTGSDTYTVSKKDGSSSKTYKIKKNKNPGKCDMTE